MEELNTVKQGDCREILINYPAEFFDVVITSPPYWKKREYGVKAEYSGWYGELGQEDDPKKFVDHLIDIFRIVKRVLNRHGSLFVVIDDTYQDKSFQLVPERFAIRMVDELGFILRGKIIWSKRVFKYKERDAFGNPLPTPAKDRLNHAWEYVYHFVKDKKYYFDLDAVKTQYSPKTVERLVRYIRNEEKFDPNKHKYSGDDAPPHFFMKERIIRSKFLDSKSTYGSLAGRVVKILAEGKENEKILIRKAVKNVNGYLKMKLKESGLTLRKLSEITGIRESTLSHYFRTDPNGAAIPSRGTWELLKPILGLGEYDEFVKEEYKPVLPILEGGRSNPGDCVYIPTENLSEKHFAPFPTNLVEFLLKMACPKRVCIRCNRPEGICRCLYPKWRRGRVLDPMGGSGTTGVVARRMGFDFLMVDISPEYCEISRKRIFGEGAMLGGNS